MKLFDETFDETFDEILMKSWEILGNPGKS
jgi:hypothetical protein